MRTYAWLTVVGVAGAAFAATMLGAQPAQRLVITPYVGMFAPTTNLVELADHTASVRQKAAGSLGLNASYWLGPRVAIELGGAYAFSDTRTRSAISVFQSDRDLTPGRDVSQNARVLLGSVKAMVALLPPDARANLRLGFGPAIISHGGSAYRSDAGRIMGRTDLGGAISLCSKISITNTIAVRARVEDYLYQAGLAYRDDTNPLENIAFVKKFQSDLLFSAGLQIALFR